MYNQKKRSKILRHAIPALANTGQAPPPLPPTPRQDNTKWIIFGVVGCGAALMVGIIVLSLLAAIMLPALARAREAARRASCQNNLKQMGLVFKMWSVEHGDQWPTLSSEPGTFMCESRVFPDYVSDPSIFECPSDPDPTPATSGADAVDDHSYFYLGYIIQSREEAQAFLDAYRTQVSQDGSFGEALQAGGFRLYPLTEELPEETAYMSPSEIPVMFDRSLTHHVPSGINVLYMDGHVEFIRAEGRFPAQQWFLDALDEIEAEVSG